MSANKDSAYGYLLTVLKNATITVDWKGVANELTFYNDFFTK